MAIPAFVNEQAGEGGEASRVLADAGFDVRTVDPLTLRDLVQQSLRDGTKRLVVAGGDGTLSCAADVMVGTDAELAIVPAGTLNHLAKDLGLPADLAQAAAVAATGRSRPVDVGTVGTHVFLNTSSAGAYVTFVRVRERWRPRLGYWIASAIAAAHILMRVPKFRVAVEIDGIRREYYTPLVFVGVGERELKLPTLGARVPGGRRGLHVMIVRSGTGARILALGLAAAARGIHAVARTPAMDAFFVDRCRIEPRSGGAPIRTISIDGEIVSVQPPLDYEFVRDGLRVVSGEAD